jgi:hypothetical protein
MVINMAKDEDVVEVEEVEDNEDEEDKRSRRKTKDDDGDKELKKSRRKKILAVIVVIIIIVSIFIAFFFLMPNVKKMYLDIPQPTEDGISVGVHIILEGGGSANGDADIEILYGAEKVYSGTVEINRDEGTAYIDYNEFVVGNDDYTVKVTFRGKSVSQTFNLQESPLFWTVVENFELNIYPNPWIFNETVDPNVKLNVGVNIKDTSGNNPNAHAGKSEVTLKVRHENSAEVTYTEEVTNEFGVVFDQYNYFSQGTGTGSGNYTITVIWENQWVKSDADTYEVEVVHQEYFNMDIVADAGDSSRTVTIPLLSTSETEEFDASDSKNDGEITVYQWDFDYQDDNDDNELDFTVDAVGKKVSHTYTNADIGNSYTVALRIYGDGILNPGANEDPIYEFSFDFVEVNVRAGGIS